MSKKYSFHINRLKSIVIAAKGALLLIKSEASIKVQVAVSILVTCAGFYFEISNTEWLIQLLAIGLVLGIEALNTAIEEIADFIHPNHHKKIGYINI
jgi:diacylglycerol kinase (ATP)